MDCPKSAPPGRDQILEVVRAHLTEIDECAKKQHAIDPALSSGTIVMKFWIKPTGHTTSVSVVSPEFKKALVGTCIRAKISKWHFGAFSGKRVGPINFPFKLKTH
jgi:hypothetical protein